MTKNVRCPACNGYGFTVITSECSIQSHVCDNCNGSGEIEVPMTNADRILAMSYEELEDLFREVYNAGCDDATAWECGTRQNTFIWDEEWFQQPAEGE